MNDKISHLNDLIRMYERNINRGNDKYRAGNGEIINYRVEVRRLRGELKAEMDEIQMRYMFGGMYD